VQELRKQLPAPQYVLSHSPEPPYLDPAWHGGPYLDILRKAGDEIDWIIVQYYNNPGFNDPLPVDRASAGPGTNFAGLTGHAGHLGWPANKILVGKPIYRADAATGHLTPDDVEKTIALPLLATYGDTFGGLAGWQFSTLTDDHRAWNNEVGDALTKARSNANGAER